MVSTFAVLAFLITLSGVIGVVAYNVSQQRKEIGIRVALGATPQKIRKLFVFQGLSLALAGLALGAAIMFFASPLLAQVLYKTDPANPLIYLITAFAVGSVAALAILLPTQQAMSIQPMEALREQ